MKSSSCNIRAIGRLAFGLLLSGWSGLFCLSAWGIQYRYDSLDRLTSVLYDNGARIEYGYDVAGNIVSIVQISASPVPGAPTDLRVVPGDRQFRVSFVAPVVAGTSAIVGYTVTCTPANGGPSISAFGTSPPILVTGLSNRVLYACSLHASNSAGGGVESTTVHKKAGVPSIAPILSIILN